MAVDSCYRHGVGNPLRNLFVVKLLALKNRGVCFHSATYSSSGRRFPVACTAALGCLNVCSTGRLDVFLVTARAIDGWRCVLGRRKGVLVELVVFCNEMCSFRVVHAFCIAIHACASLRLYVRIQRKQKPSSNNV